jgi:hypothetical protein
MGGGITSHLSYTLPSSATTLSKRKSPSAALYRVLRSVAPAMSIEIPEEFFVRIGYESIDLLRLNMTPFMQLPYQIISSWESSSNMFRFTVDPSSLLLAGAEQTDDARFAFMCAHAPRIEDAVFNAVEVLMSDMMQSSLSPEEFTSIIASIVSPMGSLIDGWKTVLAPYSGRGRGKKLQAKQGISSVV